MHDISSQEMAPDLEIQKLGPCRISSPVSGVFTSDTERVLVSSLVHEVQDMIAAGRSLPGFEVAGPREKIFFDPAQTRCGIVTCGGLCPGLNDVIRSIVYSLYYHYGVKEVFGFPYGFEGLSLKIGHQPLPLNVDTVEDIHQRGGTILASSRGPQDPQDMADFLEKQRISILFVVGGDGTLRGGKAIADELTRRGRPVAVIGIPKTIDNDILWIQQSFGFDTAVTESRVAIYAAHSEATGAKNGIGLVKLMGRESGFIAAYATMANSDVNFCLIPEVPFTLEGFLAALRERLEQRGHAVIVAGEGAGQNLVESTGAKDKSGNVKFADIGLFLRERIKDYFHSIGMEANLKYIDPSYIIRSLPANARDAATCLMLGHAAVHAGMSGRTNMVVGTWKGEITHVPIPAVSTGRKRINPQGRLWNSVLATTGQPRQM